MADDPRDQLRKDADMLRSTSRVGETSMSRVEAFERLFKQLPELVDELERLRDDRGSIALEIEHQESSTEQDVYDALADATDADAQVSAVMPFLETAWKCADQMFNRARQAEAALVRVRALLDEPARRFDLIDVRDLRAALDHPTGGTDRG